MRIFLIVLCLVAMIATGWHAVFKGTAVPYMSGAPQIARSIEKDVRATVAVVASGPVEVRVSGRNVVLSGSTASAGERDLILAAVRGVALVGTVTSDATAPETASPFMLVIEKSPDGALTLTGHVPDAATQSELLGAARAAAPEASVTADLVVVAGVPGGDWAGMVRSGLAGLTNLDAGTFALFDATATLSGQARDAGARDAAAAAIANAPMGEWTFDVGGVPPEGGFRFSAVKAPDGSITVDGHAPDDETRAVILLAAAARSEVPVGGGLEIATGMPDAAWPDRVMSGLTALDGAANGSLNVTGDTVSLIVVVTSQLDVPPLQALFQEGWETKINVLNPTPLANVVISLSAAGAVTTSGLLPAGLEPVALAAALPGADVSGLNAGTRGLAADWIAPLEGLSIVLPRLRTAQARLVGSTLVLKGALKRGYSAEGVEASLRTVMASDWELVLELTERSPLAEVILARKGDEITLSGVLPTGLSPADALAILGEITGGEGLTGGGDGDAAAWRRGLVATAASLGLFGDVTGRLGARRVEFDGTLLPGYTRGAVSAWLALQLAEGWDTGLTVTESAASEGDTRVNLATGETESFRRGFWLHDLDFSISPESCGTEITAMLDGREISFVIGSALIDDAGRDLLDRLAAVTARCLGDAALRLEIDGHTDSVGNDALNQRLSEARATAVKDALAERGVEAGRMSALGRGEADPIASNNTRAGRAANNRIAFRWLKSDDANAGQGN